MTAEAVQQMWFSPIAYIAYLGGLLVLMVLYYQWRWSKRCDHDIKVVEVKADGSSEVHYAPKQGSSVAITNPHTGTTKLWPITDLSSFDMIYPGDGFIPTFLQKKIRTTVVDELDWEPMLNRSAYNEMVASPDVKDVLTAIANSLPSKDKNRKRLLELAGGLKAASTREMIANPAVLGNIAKEKVSELAVAVARDIVNPLQEAIKRLKPPPNAMIVYLGLGLIGILLVVAVYLLFSLNQQLGSVQGQGLTDLVNNIAKIMRALGIQ